MPPTMKPVTSKNILAVGHDPEANELHVHFKDGSKYKIHDVDAEKHGALMDADSIGSHFAKVIRPHHKATKL
jgi:hypothetical protein